MDVWEDLVRPADGALANVPPPYVAPVYCCAADTSRSARAMSLRGIRVVAIEVI